MSDSSQPDDSQLSQNKSEKSHGKNAVEWTVFACSSALVMLVLGYLVFLIFTSEQTTPQLRVSLGQSVERDGQIWVPVTVENRGTVTAGNVEIEVERPDGTSAGFSLPHVPRYGERKGWVGFDPPLKTQQLKARVRGYEVP